MARLVNPFSGVSRGDRGANGTGNWRVPPVFSGGYPPFASPQVRGANDTGNWVNQTTGQSLYPAFLPLAGGVPPTLFADFTTEGTSDHYWYSGAQYANFAAWNTAIGGTFSRSSNATYLNSGTIFSASSGVARFPTDINGNSTGIRLTGAGTNILLNSGAVGTGAWGNIAQTITSNATTDPSGGSAATKAVPTTANSSHPVYQVVGQTAGPYTFYMFVKLVPGSAYSYVVLQPTNSGSISASFNLVLGTVSGTTSSTATITALANGWFLCSVTATVTTNAGAVSAYYPSPDGSTISFAGDGTSGHYIWGAQATATAFQLDYIPTTTGTVTQAADSLTTIAPSILTGAASVFIGVTMDTASATASGLDEGLWRVPANTSGSLGMDRFSADMAFRGTSINADTGLTLTNTQTRVAAAYNVGDVAVVKNGGTPFTSSALSALGIGVFGLSLGIGNVGVQGYATFQKVGVWSSRISNANLQSIST
jgi:hypothetical protein